MEKSTYLSTEYFHSQEFTAYLMFSGLVRERTFIYESKKCYPITAKHASYLHKNSATAVNIYQEKPGRPSIDDITQYLNFLLDFEIKHDPEKTIPVAESFLFLLAQAGYCRADLPYVISGAGVHVQIPIEPIQVSNGQEFNQKVAAFVEAKILPLFQKACTQHNVTMKLECFDIARIISTPGTYRAPKSGDHPSLQQGFLRRWSRIPESREAYLSPKIREEILAQPPIKKKQHQKQTHVEVKMIAPAEGNHLSEAVYFQQIQNMYHQSKKIRRDDRSAAFATLVNTFLNDQRKKGRTQEQALGIVLSYAHLFDIVAGGAKGPKYQKRAQAEVARLWNTFLWGGVKTGIYIKHRNVAVSETKKHRYKQFLSTVLVPKPGAKTPLEAIRLMSRKYGFSLTDKQIGQFVYGTQSDTQREKRLLLCSGKRQACIVDFELVQPATKYRLTLISIEICDIIWSKKQGTGKQQQKQSQQTHQHFCFLMMSNHSAIVKKVVSDEIVVNNKDPPSYYYII